MKSTDDLVRVVIIDDDIEICESLCWILNSDERFKCVGTYTSCTEALRNIENTTPDVVLMDIGLQGKSGIECVATFKERFPKTEILMLTVYSEDEKVFQSIRAGAVGYILKKTSSNQLLNAIWEAKNGGAPMSPEIARLVLDYLKETAPEGISSAGLSARELDVLQYLVQGYSYKVIAEKLFISVHTVRFHLHNIYEKLHVRSRAEAAAKAGAEKFFKIKK